jgi:hypothetical protein
VKCDNDYDDDDDNNNNYYYLSSLVTGFLSFLALLLLSQW